MRCVNILILIALFPSISTSAEEVDYIEHIKPVLRARCYACHGALKQEAELRLDTAESIRASGIVDNGTLLERLGAEDPAVRMPPEGEALKPIELMRFRRWISSGAKAPEGEMPESDPNEHWAFKPIIRPAIPHSTYKNPIDAFLEVNRVAIKVTPLQRASADEITRRLYMNLIGMPPLGDELRLEDDASVNTQLPILVDQLLADSRHGERWGRHWMDVWRYSDWWGLGAQHRNSHKFIWHWRDWIVESLNSDLGYDEMVRQMLAGDELYPNDLDKLRGSGYLVRNWFLFNRNQWMDETVEHVAKGFLGLTLNCAKCHDHKFDPVGQHEYYQFRAFFEPYHVRVDMLPGETDLSQDGIPRPYDAAPETPTYLFQRGNDQDPDLSTALAPDIPQVLKLPLPEIKKVTLPVDAWKPGLRPDVLASYIQHATQEISERQMALTNREMELLNAKEKYEASENRPAAEDVTPSAESYVDDFSELDDQAWKVYGGEWKLQDDGLAQLKDGAQRSVLRLRQPVPDDFEATLKFVTTGGSRWRSIGIEFDAVVADPTSTLKAGESANNIYISGYQQGPKIQASYAKEGPYQYPSNGLRQIQFETNREYEFMIRVRDNLVNAYLNGELMLAWRSPLARRKGALQLSAFDVLAVFKSFKLRELPDAIKLEEAGANPDKTIASGINPKDAYAQAKVNVEVAKQELEIANTRLKGLERSVVWFTSVREGAEDASSEARLEAIQSAREVATLEAKRDLTIASAALEKGKGDGAKLKKEFETAQEKVAQYELAMSTEIPEDAEVELLVGAKWTPTRFASSGSDDPTKPFLPHSTGRRTALAAWIANSQNPLTARVAVNHVWLRHMGQPLVRTVFDFGRNGHQPENQELLDWLASEFMQSGWSFKHLHRLILSSEAYLMSSRIKANAPQLVLDAENDSWWRRVPMRLESQAVRDSILRLGDQLDLHMGGPPIESGEQTKSKRRSLYFFHSNNSRNLFLTMFDEALVTDCYQRETSIVPQQALAMANSTMVLNETRPIAAYIASKTQDDNAFIEYSFQHILGVEATAEELEVMSLAWRRWETIDGESKVDRQQHLVWVLLNHNDFLVVR